MANSRSTTTAATPRRQASSKVSDDQITASAGITLVVSKNPPRDNAMSIMVGASASTGSVLGGGYM
ncbi:hypothetical protein [Xanthomonas nasturtii]|uniref:hypothetical protein n=1 Tax=Xanthomonas nasturtii TaxID=1843581 RepID=UPI002010D832|nr:hypothetical protein [Xanthomonas nasturtii]